METGRAKELLAEFIRAEIAVVHSVNSSRGLTKKAAKEEFQAANAIYKELTGVSLTEEEWREISG